MTTVIASIIPCDLCGAIASDRYSSLVVELAWEERPLSAAADHLNLRILAAENVCSFCECALSQRDWRKGPLRKVVQAAISARCAPGREESSRCMKCGVNHKGECDEIDPLF